MLAIAQVFETQDLQDEIVLVFQTILEDRNDHREIFQYPNRSITVKAAPELISPTHSSGASMKG